MLLQHGWVITSFKASNGWLESFNKCRNIKQFIVKGEAEDVSEKIVEGWHENVYNQANMLKLHMITLERSSVFQPAL